MKILITINPYWQWLLKFIKQWNEILTIPLGIALFYFFPILLRTIDPVSASYDMGVLHTAIVAIAIMLILHGFAWILLKITFPGVFRFLDDVFESHVVRTDSLQPSPSERDKMFTLTTYQKCVLSLSVFALYLLGTILLVKIF